MTIPFLQPGKSLQAERRGWSDDFTDQHGRRFAAQYELANSRPIGELSPVGFQPPWLPPMGVIKWDRHGSFRFHWDYDTLAADWVDNSVSYYAGVMDFMLEHMKGEPIPELGEPVPSMVIRSPLGPPPLSPAIVLACQAGDPWALGVPDAPVNESLKAALTQSTTTSGRAALLMVKRRMQEMVGEHGVPTLVPEANPEHLKPKSIMDEAPLVMSEISYQEFVASCRGRGKMNMVEIVQAWKDHKAFMDQPQADAEPVEAVA